MTKYVDLKIDQPMAWLKSDDNSYAYPVYDFTGWFETVEMFRKQKQNGKAHVGFMFKGGSGDAHGGERIVLRFTEEDALRLAKHLLDQVLGGGLS